ncbi:Fructose-1,6-bisphosphatase class 2 [Paenibacillus allorhizoplanae]|uniref:Fructose-1,6-bisphosphatase n=1 Tax=Paenibacillus allorhizoplanae TaxID=2905648 RepID=A0ABM9C428_9BACL|nr:MULTISPECIES: class II fructose-bisphosphatase [Paenibacillus]KRE69467.1 fructose 1,6-bisphosphatase [Paenibacillus sp. Soil750]CAH1201903.1 Fructose-1,6-bisphosphatase class 2 [Paenibacillus allorhizoplanae]
MHRDLSLEIVRVTEAAAIASSSWTGKGNKHDADGAATSAMREYFSAVPFRGTVVIGEGEMDEAPMLYIGEEVGSGVGPEFDVAVDPLEGTDIVASGRNNALSVVAIAEKGNLLHAPDMYMAKLAVGPRLAGKLSLEDPLEVTIQKAASILHKEISELTVSILDRNRHAEHIMILRKLGVKIYLLSDGDVAGAMAVAFPETGIDLHVGSGGAPEGVLAAAALRCMGGELQGRLLPENEEEHQRCLAMGISDPSKVLSMRDLVGDSDIIFAATGVTSGDFLHGVKYGWGGRAQTHSVVMRAETQTVRFIQCVHQLHEEQRGSA